MGRALHVLPFNLDEIQVASPCSMSWADMVGGDKVRFCGACQKNVFNLSGMTRPEAMALVQASEGRVCVRFFRRPDGTVLTEDCPVGLRQALKRAKKATLGALATTVGAVAALLAFLGTGVMARRTCSVQAPDATVLQGALEELPTMGQPTMGEMVAPPAPPVSPPPEKMGKVAPVRELKGRLARPKPQVREIMGDVALPPPKG